MHDLKERSPDLYGRLGFIGLIELLQLAELGEYSAVLSLSTQGAPLGKVFLKKGAILKAEHQHLQNTEALLAMLRQTQGDFKLWAYEHPEDLIKQNSAEFAVLPSDPPPGVPFVQRSQHKNAITEAPLRISSVLLEHLRLEDELLHFSDAQLPWEQPISLKSEKILRETPAGYGSELILETIRNRPGVSLQQLRETLPLAPQRIEVAVAWLHSQDHLNLKVTPRISTQMKAVSDTWLSRLLLWKHGRLRLLFACASGVSVHTLEQDLRALRDLLKAEPFSLEGSMNGPSFVRLRSAAGEVVSFTFLPLSHKHRFLFQTFAQGTDLALVPDEVEPIALAELLPDIKSEYILKLPTPLTSNSLIDALQSFTKHLPFTSLRENMAAQERVQQVLRTLVNNTPDLEAAALVSIDGLILASVLPAGTDEDRVSAMAAGLQALGERTLRELARGTLEQIYVKGSQGYIVLVQAGSEAVLEAIAGPGAKLGMVLLDMKRAAQECARLL